jgi:NAD(P)-dependent dehydrogenase (short-subunit alcohol dehydrogenase family)
MGPRLEPRAARPVLVRNMQAFVEESLMQELEGKVAFITGGASGIGLGQAKVLAEEARMRVAIADVQQNRLDEATSYFRSKHVPIHALLLDITDRAAYARAADEVEQALGPVQVLFNTAGVSARGPVEMATYDDWDWHLGVNLNGVINGVQTFLPRMIKYGHGGHIVNTASISSFFAIPTAALYTTTKFALRGLSESLRIELSKFDIGVSCLCPGSVNTNILDASVTRPAIFAHTGFVNDPEAHARVKALLQAGFDPVDLARVTLEAIKRNDFWIFPYPEYVSRIEEQTREVIDAMNLWIDHPEYARRIKQREA